MRIIKDWEGEETFSRQTPNSDGIWEGVKFTLEEVQDCDYLIVWNRPPMDIRINCLEGGKWIIAGEPPTPLHGKYSKSYKYFNRVFSQFPDKTIKNNIYTQGSLPWHINKSYKELKSLKPGAKGKKGKPSIINSSVSFLEGHEKRQNFIHYLQNKGYELDIYGRGINPIADKFDALYPYKYSFAIENSNYLHYWTEKIADCFLSWTMPIYYGCPNITDYFPSEAIIKIDLDKPEESLQIIQEAILYDKWGRNLEAIKEARNLVLDKYQFYPKMVEQIRRDKSTGRKSYYIPKCAPFWEDSTFTHRVLKRLKQVNKQFKIFNFFRNV